MLIFIFTWQLKLPFQVLFFINIKSEIVETLFQDVEIIGGYYLFGRNKRLRR